jgi:hypothetical protein
MLCFDKTTNELFFPFVECGRCPTHTIGKVFVCEFCGSNTAWPGTILGRKFLRHPKNIPSILKLIKRYFGKGWHHCDLSLSVSCTRGGVTNRFGSRGIGFLVVFHVGCGSGESPSDGSGVRFGRDSGRVGAPEFP